MSKGLGWVQRECLRAIRKFESVGQRPTTYDVVAEVYDVKQDQYGNQWINDAQYSAVKRALASLRRKGLVAGEQVFELNEHGRKLFILSQHPRGYAQRCCLWATAPLSTLHDPEMAAGESLSGS